MSNESDITQLKVDVAGLKQQLEDINSAKKTGDQFATASSINSGDKVIIIQGSEMKIYDAEGTIQPTLYIEQFVATHDQTNWTVSQAQIADNKKWKVYINGQSVNSTTGVLAFTGGAIDIVFGTGAITFNTALNEGDQVRVEYNT